MLVHAQCDPVAWGSLRAFVLIMAGMSNKRRELEDSWRCGNREAWLSPAAQRKAKGAVWGLITSIENVMSPQGHSSWIYYSSVLYPAVTVPAEFTRAEIMDGIVILILEMKKVLRFRESWFFSFFFLSLQVEVLNCVVKIFTEVHTLNLC